MKARDVVSDAIDNESDDDDDDVVRETNGGHLMVQVEGQYAAGKWGRYLRAPDLYFEIMARFGNRFVPLGEIVEIRRGITSGCDAFFMPKDVTHFAACAVTRTKRSFARPWG